MKRILFLADVNSAHTRKWAVSLAEKGFTIGIFSLGEPESDWYKGKNISVFSAEIGKRKFSSVSFSKISYLKSVPYVKKIIRKFKPDILHAHYATSYGIIGVCTGFHPYIISAWGSDVMDFPNKSFLHKLILKRILFKADKLFATSKTIEKCIHRVIKKNVVITPFGIDTEIFKPMKVPSVFRDGEFVIGTIKSLEKVYCIDILLKTFAQIKKDNSNIKLMIVGEGNQKKELESLVKKLKIEKDVLFTGKIDHADVARYHNTIDIFVNIPERESFGVSVLEAMGCGKPVIVTDTGGLGEIVKDDSVGFKVPVRDAHSLSEKLNLLLANSELRKTIGRNAQEHVLQNYNWKKNLEQIITEYENLLK